MEQLNHDLRPEFEENVLSSIVLDPDFILDYRSIIDAEAFKDENNCFIIRTILTYYDEYSITPSVDVLNDLVSRSMYRDKGGVRERITNLNLVPDRNYVRDKLLSWVKWTAIDRVVQSNTGSLPHEFAHEINEASRIGDELLMKHTKLDGDDDGEELRGKTIPTPWPWLNDQLGGGPEIGDLAVVLTVISGGKTTALVNIARHALSLGMFVVYFTFEDGEMKIKRRLIQSIVDVTRQELRTDKERIYRAKNRFLMNRGGRCEIKDLPSRRCTVDQAAAMIRTIEESCERKVDLVVTDYADRFRANNKYNEPRHALKEIFEDCKWLARSLNVMHWTARQVNKSKVGKDIVGTDSAGESWGSMESPDLVIGLGRTMMDEELGRSNMYTAKVRDDRDHQQISLVTDWSRQRIVESIVQ